MSKKFKRFKPKEEEQKEVYYFDYPNEPIGGSNPYWCCQSCKISDPQINGRLENHSLRCEWRIAKEKEIE